MGKHRKKLALLAGLALIAAACGNDDDSDVAVDEAEVEDDADDADDTAGDEDAVADDDADLTQVTAGLVPVGEAAPFFLADEMGFFEERGLEVQAEFGAGGAVIVPSVESGEFDIGLSNVVSLMLAQAEGIEFTVLAGGGVTATGDDPDFSQLLVLEDSDIESYADLEGRRVAINTLRNVLEVVLREAVDDAGGNQEAVEFVEIPFPDMAAALQSGEVDAIQHNEPFQTLLQMEGDVRTVGQPFVDAAGGEILAAYFVKTENADADWALAFREAMAEANAVEEENPGVTRDLIPTYSDVTPELAQEIVQPPFVEDSIRRSSLERYGELMTKFGLLDDPPDVDALLPEDVR